MALQRSNQLNIDLTILETFPSTHIQQNSSTLILNRIHQSLTSILTRFHAGYFRITFSLASQALLWKTLINQNPNKIFRSIFTPFWSFVLLTLISLTTLYLLKCILLLKKVKQEFLHHVGVNYLFAPSISWLLLLQSSPLISSKTTTYLILWWLFTIPIIALDVKIYGQWFIRGKKKLLSTVANPTSQLSVIGNLVGSQAAANMGWRETAVCLFSLGLVHYFVLFVTLYQRLAVSDRLPAMLRPVFFLFFAAPSVASLAWENISGGFDIGSKMLFFLSLFLFASLVRCLGLKFDYCVIILILV